MDVVYEAERLFIALNELAQYQSLHPRYITFTFSNKVFGSCITSHIYAHRTQYQDIYIIIEHHILRLMCIKHKTLNVVLGFLMPHG